MWCAPIILESRCPNNHDRDRSAQVLPIPFSQSISLTCMTSISWRNAMLMGLVIPIFCSDACCSSLLKSAGTCSHEVGMVGGVKRN